MSRLKGVEFFSPLLFRDVPVELGHFVLDKFINLRECILHRPVRIGFRLFSQSHVGEDGLDVGTVLR